MERFAWPMTAAELARFAAIVRSGGIVIVPTDTVYGIAAAPECAAALARIVAAKGRDPAKPCQLLSCSASAAERAGVKFSAAGRRVADAFWPGPLTLVLETSSAARATEGVRVPALAAALALCEAAGGCLRCTSANKSGEAPALTVEEAVAAIPEADAAIDAGPSPGGVSSTVAAVSARGEVKIFRHGPVDRAALEAAAATTGGGGR
ncbi:MAG: Sua5/YciO/YrdC/YwlC family protein [Kiritimatiellae bacterium]|nr:Sua5/YciO/YrdC/YwlC family protein [Kiritimatiellia bacterium]